VAYNDPTRRLMSRRSMLKGAALVSAGAFVPWIVGCGDDDSTSPATTAPAGGSPTTAGASPTATAREVSITMQTGWYAQVESSAVLAGVVYNTFPSNLKVTVKDGGPGSTPVNLVATGQLDMATINADTLLFARDQGLPVKAVMAPMAINPLAFASHKDLGITGFPAMKGHKIAVSKGVTYWDYLKKQFGFSDSDQTTYNGSLAVWLQDKSLITQVYATNEPFQMQQQNVPYDIFLLKDGGYDSPGNMLGFNEDFLKKNADVMPSFIKGVQDGIAKAVADPAPLFAEIAKRSPTTSEANMTFSWGEAKKMMNTPYQLEHGFGAIDPGQMSGLYALLSDLKLFKSSFKVEDAYTTEFDSPAVVKTT
jgi:NitT/TauT family transport system substrate-binding protein